VTGYSSREIARIFGLSAARLRTWERKGLVRPALRRVERAAPAAEPETEAVFGFQDLVRIKTVLALLGGGVPLRRIRESVESVRTRLPEIDEPLRALRLWHEGSRRVVVRHAGRLVEPSGQVVLDLGRASSANAGAGASPQPLRAPAAPPADAEPATASAWFERGCQLDLERPTWTEAIRAYERAIELEPAFADAHCNLGTVYYNQGRRALARACYERTLELEAEHVEAHFNLANLLEEEERNEAALRHYKAAMRADPLYADVQLNLALLYEKLGLRRKAREHWRRYLQLEPAGAWAEVARKHLAE
jgi:tetratricopeptide (TPR) repeat protein